MVGRYIFHFGDLWNLVLLLMAFSVGFSWERLYGSWIKLFDVNRNLLGQQQITSGIGNGMATYYFSPTPNVYYIRVQLSGTNFLSISELQAWGYVS